MADRTQEELQQKLVELGWTISEPSQGIGAGEDIPLRELARARLVEQPPIPVSSPVSSNVSSYGKQNKRRRPGKALPNEMDKALQPHRGGVGKAKKKI